jgi:hypothetical protein
MRLPKNPAEAQFAERMQKRPVRVFASCWDPATVEYLWILKSAEEEDEENENCEKTKVGRKIRSSDDALRFGFYKAQTSSAKMGIRRALLRQKQLRERSESLCLQGTVNFVDFQNSRARACACRSAGTSPQFHHSWGTQFPSGIPQFHQERPNSIKNTTIPSGTP